MDETTLVSAAEQLICDIWVDASVFGVDAHSRLMGARSAFHSLTSIYEWKLFDELFSSALEQARAREFYGEIPGKWS